MTSSVPGRAVVISGAVNANASPHMTEQTHGLSVASSHAPCPSGKARFRMSTVDNRPSVSK